MKAILPAALCILTTLPLAAQVGIPATPNRFDTRKIGDAISGGSAVNVAPLRPQAAVKTVTHIVLGEPRQWKMADGKSFVGKLIAFEDIVTEGAAAPTAPPKSPTVVRNGAARFYVNSKCYEVALNTLGVEERKFIEAAAAAIAAKK